MKSASDNIKKVIALIPEAIGQGGEIICFNEWFLGTNPPDKIPNKFTDVLSQFAKKNNITIITGNFRIQIDAVGKKFVQVSCIIDKSGEIVLKQQKINLYKGEKAWFVPGKEVDCCNIDIGRVMVTSGFDSVDDKVYNEVQNIKPNIWVAQANEHLFSVNEDSYQTLTDIMVKRSKNLSCTIVVPMILGNFYGSNYKGRSFIAKNGAIVVRSDSSEGFAFYDI
jgi:predicted amidohydrolase